MTILGGAVNLEDIRFYRAQERFGCVVRDWPTVWRMPRKFPNGRLKAVSLADVVAELRSVGYRIEEPTESPKGSIAGDPCGEGLLVAAADRPRSNPA